MIRRITRRGQWRSRHHMILANSSSCAFERTLARPCCDCAPAMNMPRVAARRSAGRFAQTFRARLVERLGIERAIVGGSSMEAAIATRFALDRPHMVAALALIRPARLDQPSPKPLRLLETIGDLLEQFPIKEGRRRFESLPAASDCAKLTNQRQRRCLTFSPSRGPPKVACGSGEFHATVRSAPGRKSSDCQCRH